MAADLSAGVEVVGVATVRDVDGLALSSRNRYLTPHERRTALALSRALRAGRQAAGEGTAAVLAAAKSVLAAESDLSVDYLELRSPDLSPAPAAGESRLLVAARVGGTRLIDNRLVEIGVPLMLVTVAVQNARTAVGVHDGGDLRSCWRLATEPQRTADEWSHLVASLVGGVCAPDDVTGFAVCSAVPAVLHELRHVGRAAFPSAEVVVVGPGVRSGLPVLTDNPREVGTDRIANVVGALDVFGAAACRRRLRDGHDVRRRQRRRAVHRRGDRARVSTCRSRRSRRRAAQLRQVELSEPRSAIAKNTVEALQSGLGLRVRGPGRRDWSTASATSSERDADAVTVYLDRKRGRRRPVVLRQHSPSIGRGSPSRVCA